MDSRLGVQIKLGCGNEYLALGNRAEMPKEGFYTNELGSGNETLMKLGSGKESQIELGSGRADSNQKLETEKGSQIDSTQLGQKSKRMSSDTDFMPQSEKLKSDTELKQFSCSICEKKFTSQKYVSRHNREVHIKERKHQCSRCNKGFFKNSYIKKHSCDGTNKSRDHPTNKKLDLGSEKEVENQFSSHTNNDPNLPISESLKSLSEKEKFSCPICGKKFATKKYISVHTRDVHIKERNHHCARCNREFFTISNLKRHSCNWKINQRNCPTKEKL